MPESWCPGAAVIQPEPGGPEISRDLVRAVGIDIPGRQAVDIDAAQLIPGARVPEPQAARAEVGEDLVDAVAVDVGGGQAFGVARR